MKKQVVYIHGGDTWKPHEDFLRMLKGIRPDKEDFIPDSKNRWHKSLQKNLGSGFEVFRPDMPNADISKYVEWKVWFEKMLPFLEKGPVYIGHSLGAIFLARYFAENPDKKGMRGLLLVAPPYAVESSSEGMEDFFLPKDISKLKSLGSKVYIYGSKDDPTVPFSDIKKYEKALPEANLRIFRDKGHFRVKDLPELTKDILALYARNGRSRA